MANEKRVYETPEMEIVEFELEDAIAFSVNPGPDAFCTEGSYE